MQIHSTREARSESGLASPSAQTPHTLIWSNVHLWDSQQSVLIEEAVRHQQLGHRVSILLCKSALIGCPANPKRRAYRCIACRTVQGSQKRRLSKSGFSFISLRLSLRRRVKFRLSRVKLRLARPPLQEEIFQETIGDLRTGAYAISELRSNPRATKLTSSQLRMAQQVLSEAAELQRSCKQIHLSEQLTGVVCWNGRRMSDGYVAQCFQKIGVEVRSVVTGLSMDSYIAHNSSYVFGDLKNRFNQFRADTRISQVHSPDGKQFIETYAQGGEYPGAPPVVTGPLGEFSSRNFCLAITSNWAIETSHLLDSFRYEVSNLFEAYLESIDRAVTALGKEIVLRWHPNLANANRPTSFWLDSCIARYSNIVHIRPENPINTYALVDRAELILDFGSTVGVYAAATGKDVVHLTPNSMHVDGPVPSPASLIGILQMGEFSLEGNKVDQRKAASDWFQFQNNLEIERQFTRLDGIHGPAFYQQGGQWIRLSPPWYFARPEFVRHQIDRYRVLPQRKFARKQL